MTEQQQTNETTEGRSELSGLVRRLKAEGFTGLYYPGECGCSLDEPAPCGEDHSQCKPGYVILDMRPGHVEYGDFAVFGKKEVTEDDWENITY